MIKIDGLTKRYGDHTALDDLQLDLFHKEFVAILGPSGCGKTTLLRLLAGFIQPDTGSIHIGGRLVASPSLLVPPEQRDIGMVFQSFALWPHMTVQEHIEFPLRQRRDRGMRQIEDHGRRVIEILEMMGLEKHRKRYPAELSGGQRQRVSLARAIAPRPQLLLMDEPLSALDAELRMEMRKEIQAIHRQLGTAIVFVTHDQGEALAMADRIVVMNSGSIEQVGTPEWIYTKPKSIFVSTFVGKSNVIKGKWADFQTFIPEGHPAIWPDIGVTPELKKQQVYPVRPEQFVMEEAQEGEMTGEIMFSQFQGNEIHYTILVNGQTFTVYSSFLAKRFSPGERVSLKINQALADSHLSVYS